MNTSARVRIVTRNDHRRAGYLRRGSMSERGYVAIVTALLMTVLLLFVGLATDVGLWYSRSSAIQRATDAAALAGVTGRPTLAREIELATQSLQRNNLVNGQNGITATVGPEPGFPNRLRVTVTDANTTGVFTKLFRSAPVISRSASAEFINNISLGSAFNAIGTGSLAGHLPDSPTSTQGFWLAVSGFCTAKEDGDRLLSNADGSRRNGSFEYACNEGTPGHPDVTNAYRNEDYDNAGYAYEVNVPCPSAPVGQACPLTPETTQAITVEAFDPSYSPNIGDDPLDTRIDRKAVANSQHWAWWYSAITTTFNIYGPDATPEDSSDDVVIGGPYVYRTCQWAPGCPGETNAWAPLMTIPAGSAGGKYRVQVHTETNEWEAYGHNAFALRARLGATWAPCTTIPAQPGYDATCPSVAGDESMSVLADKAGSTSDFFLAKLAPAEQYRGKRIRILLWDPGEGARSIQILPPGSTVPVNFRYRTWDPGLRRVSDGVVIEDRAEGWSTKLVTNTLDVSGTTPVTGTFNSVFYPVWAMSSRYGSSKYNDRLVALELTVPKNYGRDATGAPIPLPDDGWWKIRYNTDTGIVQDRTTWSVALAGDPAHLVDQED